MNMTDTLLSRMTSNCAKLEVYVCGGYSLYSGFPYKFDGCAVEIWSQV